MPQLRGRRSAPEVGFLGDPLPGTGEHDSGREGPSSEASQVSAYSPERYQEILKACRERGSYVLLERRPKTDYERRLWTALAQWDHVSRCTDLDGKLQEPRIREVAGRE